MRRVIAKRFLKTLEEAPGFLEFGAGEIMACFAEKCFGLLILVERPDKNASRGVIPNRIEYAFGDSGLASAARSYKCDNTRHIVFISSPLGEVSEKFRSSGEVSCRLQGIQNGGGPGLWLRQSRRRSRNGGR